MYRWSDEQSLGCLRATLLLMDVLKIIYELIDLINFEQK